MAHELITERNLNEGIHQLLLYLNDVTHGIFIIMMIVTIFMVFLLSSYFISLRTRGVADFPASLSVAGFVTSVVAILLRLIPGLINGFVLLAILITTMLSVLWLLSSRE